jgi:hypothetical protein
MQLGRHLRELWRLRLGVAVSFLLALLVAVSSIDHVSLFPPHVKGRQLEIAAASTRVLINSPRSEIIDLRTDTYDLTSLTSRADLLGNVMASAPVREYIARRAGIDPLRIQAVSPITANVPRALVEPGSEKRASDILRSTDQYRLDIQASPSVPILSVSAQAPNKEAAERLANGAVDGLRDYLRALAVRQGTDPTTQVRLEQLGRARGGVINRGIGLQISLLAFVFVFTLSCCAVLFLSRVRRGWSAAAREERDDAAAAAADPGRRGDRAILAPANGREMA